MATQTVKGKRGYFNPLEDREPEKKSLSLRIRGSRVSSKALSQFTSQLATLQGAGLPIVRCLRVLAGQYKPGPLKKTVTQVADDVEGGNSLSEALAKHPRVFDTLYASMVKAGEAGGVLDTILKRLADFLDKSEKLRRQVIGMMIYPAVVLTVAVLIFVGIMTFVVPKFKEIFSQLQEELPALTRAVIGASEWMKSYWWVIFLIPFAAFGTYKLVYRTSGGRRAIDSFKLRMPVFGVLVKKTAIARFSRTLGTLLSSGVPILDALAIVRASIDNRVLQAALERVQASIREGEGIAAPLGESQIFDDLIVNMIDVGEETGELDKMLEKIAVNYEEDVDVLVKGLMGVLEPALIVFIGGMVLVIVLSLFVPLLRLMERIGK
ncbi:MAG: type II secretion system F family protein [Planctomycetes bacterium]|nr:type II secretion system F family protein [Planctomycetota bacterium]MBI3844602.1 type II secretion system F family protein [Planctomycetota bacterium]